MWCVAQTLVFKEDNYRSSVPETFVEGGFLRPADGFIQVECIEQSNGSPVNANYSIVESDPGPFSIHLKAGAISVTEDLDYEVINFYRFHVHCVESDQPSLNSTATVQIEVGSVNEYLPTISPSFHQLVVFEDLAPGTIIVSVLPDESGLKTYSVADDDAWPNGIGSVRYTVLEDPSGNSENAQQFSLDSVSAGSLKLTGSLDVDSFPGGVDTVRVRITVCDDETRSELCPNLLVTLQVFSVNDNFPEFSQSVYEGTVPVSLPLDSPVDFGISCTDLDQGAGGFQGIELESPSSIWEVDSGEATVILRQPLHSLMSVFTLRCFDTDGREDTATVIVNVNYHPKLSQSVYTFSMQRVIPPPRGLGIGNVSALDINGDTIMFSLNGSDHFAIDSETGEVKLLDIVDESEGNLFQLTVTASDGSLTDTASIRVEFKEEDDGDTGLILSPGGVLPVITLFLCVLISRLFL